MHHIKILRDQSNMAICRLLVTLTAIFFSVNEFHEMQYITTSPLRYCYILILLVPNSISLIEQLLPSKTILHLNLPKLSVIVFNLSLFAVILLCIDYLFAIIFKFYLFNFFRGYGIPFGFYIPLWIVFMIDYLNLTLLLLHKFNVRNSSSSLLAIMIWGMLIFPISAFGMLIYSMSNFEIFLGIFFCTAYFLSFFFLILKSSYQSITKR